MCCEEKQRMSSCFVGINPSCKAVLRMHQRSTVLKSWYGPIILLDAALVWPGLSVSRFSILSSTQFSSTSDPFPYNTRTPNSSRSSASLALPCPVSSCLPACLSLFVCLYVCMILL
ncbi:hypothetical protein DL95DRAFT_379201 [Leptodontidium sp. 2 PMI_412]|nr:hypothetical protein BKA61DRAFT_236746 [Leptodontidium sp. MPI-SDFR-AT-0119]KAH9224249.1 hypothetical protein DL95DRAFT_379201 [Leptodontidium sp. 2 PMI_412]